ncbi:dimethylaniline monooxygenase [Calocera viscosa TUFC12733]|uniref:Dimethylaniline monooxygenase n=1 Tax=Calocera viscosa (strain TUFC12733) TaxID=1330018 RepID=A0A167LFE4_CALVF|nr:dimethylaniline monooxygenase [Calocera viscosa TUFC12733]
MAAAGIESLVGKVDNAIATGDISAFCNLFVTDGWYRDLLITSWQFHTVSAATLKGFLDRRRLPNIQNLRVDATQAVEDGSLPVQGREHLTSAFLVFTVPALGTGRGYLRAVKSEDGALQIFTLFFALQTLSNHPEDVGPRRPLGTVHSSYEKRTNWLDRRAVQREFKDVEPAVLIVGAGHSGLMLAARLTMSGVPCLVVEKSERVGDSWRKRYSTLCTHVASLADHFPGMPFPANWPIFVPKDKIANWYEIYTEAMELNVWTGCTILSGTTYDKSDFKWSVPVLQEDGTKRVLHPRHLVQATGYSGEPRVPVFEGIHAFKGKVMHSSKFYDGAPWAGKKAVVIGSCNSGHDIAQNLYESGAAEVTMVQRSSTLVYSAAAVNAYYTKPLYAENGPHHEDADIVTLGTPIPLLEKIWAGNVPDIENMDAEIHKGLTEAGFNLNKHPKGLYYLYYTRGGGYYIDTGCSRLIAEKKIKIKQGVEISRFLSDSVQFQDGTTLTADVVILATGWDAMNTTCEKVFGSEIASKTGKVWGIDQGGELGGMWRSSGHPGFWFMGGSFMLARIYSRYLALQIMATEDGVMPRGGVFE